MMQQEHLPRFSLEITTTQQVTDVATTDVIELLSDGG
jgi:hypothetical protein